MLSSEDNILKLLKKYFPNDHKGFIVGRGDDCALINVPRAKYNCNPSSLKSKTLEGFQHLLAVSSDIFTENTHFRSRYFSPAQIGHKALAANISDLASAGASPNAFVLNLTITNEQDMPWLEEFFASMADLSGQYQMGLCGGDLAKSPNPTSLLQEEKSGLNIGITVWGDYHHDGIPLFRHKYYNSNLEDFELLESRSKKEDVIFVVGEIGLARVGLFALEQSKNRSQVEEVILKYGASCQAHLTPKPLVAEGLCLSNFAKDYPLFLMDISDGLMRDVSRILMRQGLIRSTNTLKPEGSNFNLGADLFIQANNLHPEVIKYCNENDLDPIQFAYQGGEDYGLLGICSQADFDLLKSEFQKNNLTKLWKLGKIIPHELKLNSQTVEEKGFDHFC